MMNEHKEQLVWSLSFLQLLSILIIIFRTKCPPFSYLPIVVPPARLLLPLLPRRLRERIAANTLLHICRTHLGLHSSNWIEFLIFCCCGTSSVFNYRKYSFHLQFRAIRNHVQDSSPRGPNYAHTLTQGGRNVWCLRLMAVATWGGGVWRKRWNRKV